MSNSGKKTPSSPKKGLGSVPERSENDDISTSSGDLSRFSYFTRQFIASHRIKILFFCKLNRQFEVTRTKFYSMTCFKIFS